MKRLSLVILGLFISVIVFAQRYKDYRYYDDGSYSDVPEIEPIGYLFLALFALFVYLIYLAYQKVKENLSARRKKLGEKPRYKVYHFEEACIGAVTRLSIKDGVKRLIHDKKENDGFAPTYIGDQGYYNLTSGEYILLRRGLFYYKICGCPLFCCQDIVTLYVKRADFKNCAIYAGFNVVGPEKLVYDYWG